MLELSILTTQLRMNSKAAVKQTVLRQASWRAEFKISTTIKLLVIN